MAKYPVHFFGHGWEEIEINFQDKCGEKRVIVYKPEKPRAYYGKPEFLNFAPKPSLLRRLWNRLIGRK